MSDSRADQSVRLNKLIADSGLASRRQADRLIEEGHVTVNGKRVFELGVKVDPAHDRVMVDGKPLKKQSQKLYLLFNKPLGVLTTMDDPHDRPTIADYLEKVPVRVFPVGRLDWNSEGLILLTNDGDFANKVMHPSAEVTKTYLVKINGQARPDQIQKLLKGVTIIGGRVAAKSIEKIRRPDGSDQYDWYKMVITEGKNRQIRQMFEKIGFDVMKLQRVAIGCLRLGSLRKGEVVFLNDAALEKVFEPDAPEKIRAKKSYQGRSTKNAAAKRAPARRAPTKSAPSTRGAAPKGRAKPTVRKSSRA
ncbi:MAG: rRNA pseudouridine synthase [Bdellovibrionaceae bacterium]|nr:rRNA pseudouridine synthase [Pseudobdellovibrionaceae bacterium]